MKRTLLIVSWIIGAMATPAFAHQLDEYLQTTLLTLEKKSLSADLFLTPGVAVSLEVLAGIDVDGDGKISAAEQKAYVEKMVRDLAVTMNGASITPAVVEADFPTSEAMKDGQGSIHLALKFTLPPQGFERRLRWENHHQTKISAYQVNALKPTDPMIQIASIQRNYTQSIFELDYSEGSQIAPE